MIQNLYKVHSSIGYGSSDPNCLLEFKPLILADCMVKVCTHKHVRTDTDTHTQCTVMIFMEC